jgi:hypothetical protein
VVAVVAGLALAARREEVAALEVEANRVVVQMAVLGIRHQHPQAKAATEEELHPLVEVILLAVEAVLVLLVGLPQQLHHQGEPAVLEQLQH